MARWLQSLVGLFALTQGLPGAPALAQSAPTPAPSVEVVTIKLSMSNVYLLRSSKPILIDAGSPRDRAALVEALSAQGLRLQDIALVVLTHSHSDHAGLAAYLQRGGAKLAIGAGDVDMARSGQNDDLKPTNFMASLLKRFAIDPIFPAFQPDLAVLEALDLRPWGVEGRVLVKPGHTPGSVVVVLDDGRAFVGDMILGGYLGGAISPRRAGEHYFHADRSRNLDNIKSMLTLPVTTFFLGHGGPVSRAAVIEGFDLVDPAAVR